MQSKPLWLDYSGLPQRLSENIRGGAAWLLFQKIVEMDCATNPQPDNVKLTLTALSLRTGLPCQAIRKTAIALRRLKLIACFLPDDDEEEAIFRIHIPLHTPKSKFEITRDYPQFAGQPFRYIDLDPQTSAPNADPLMQEIVDLYFNHISTRMNTFILDELNLIRNRFPIDKIRRAFKRAAQNQTRSLKSITKDLSRKKTNPDSNPETSSADQR